MSADVYPLLPHLIPIAIANTGYQVGPATNGETAVHHGTVSEWPVHDATDPTRTVTYITMDSSGMFSGHPLTNRGRVFVATA